VEFTEVRFDAQLDRYDKQAAALLDSFRSGQPRAIKLFHETHPRFLDEKVPWLPKRLSDDEIARAPLTIADARLATARAYCFRDWGTLAAYVDEVASDTAVRRFEAAVEAVIAGDLAALRSSLAADPNLVNAR
jgi:hypothetical protein